MQTIKDNCVNEIIIKNSRFITYLYYITSKEEVPNYLDEVKKKWKDASHYCFAYILPHFEKASDDNEPSKTAGLPMLEILRKKELTNVLAITVRYFGGIKLGAGGLIRAYAQSVNDCLKKTTFVSLEKGFIFKICLDYSDLKKVSSLLKNTDILKEEYQEEVIITFQTSNPDLINTLHNSSYLKIITEEERLLKEEKKLI